MYNEVVIAPGATAEISQEQYQLSEKMVVDYLWVGEETLTVNGAVPVGAVAGGMHTYRTDQLTLWWYVSTRRESALRLVNALDYYTFAEAKRWSIFTAGVVPALPAVLPFNGNLVWRFLRPWRYHPGSGIVVDWDYVTGALTAPVNVTVQPVDIILYGTGVNSQHRRIFEMRLPIIPITVVAAGGANGSSTTHEFVMNNSSEPYDIDTLYIRVQDTGINLTWQDIRQLHMLRYRFRPTIGKPFSEVAVPLAAYGIDVGPIRGVHYQPTGGPLFMEEGTAMGWRITNNAAETVRAQVALFGRTEPGRW